MKKFFTWLFLLAKRQLKNPIILSMLILIPGICFIVSIFSREQTDEISYNVGVYVDGNDKVSMELADVLYSYDGSYNFIPYDDEAALYKDVTNRTLICGYILPDNLSKKISANRMSDCLTVLKQSDVTIQGAINEIVFSQLIKVQGAYIITDYVQNIQEFRHINEDYSGQLLRYYQSYLKSDVTFHMKYITYGTDGTRELDNTINTPIVFPLRGILAIVIFLAGVFGGILYLRDVEKGVLAIVSAAYRNICMILYSFIPTLFFAIVSLISMAFLGVLTHASMEIMAMVFYILIITVFTSVLVKILRKSTTLSALLPVMLICCLIFCPVFIDAGRYVPAAKFIEKLFMPYYYLEFFA